MHTEMSHPPQPDGPDQMFRTREQIVADCRAAGLEPSRWHCTACGYRMRRWARPGAALDAPRCTGMNNPHVAVVMTDLDALDAWAADPTQDDAHNPYA